MNPAGQDMSDEGRIHYSKMILNFVEIYFDSTLVRGLNLKIFINRGHSFDRK